MVASVLSTEWRKFCQTTSVRGVPRIINAKSNVHSVIWLLGVLACTCVLIWQLVVIFVRYRSHPITSVFSESPEWDNTTFPDITICNLCSLVYQDEMSISYEDYVITSGNQYLNMKSNFQELFRLFEPNNTVEEEYYYKYYLEYFQSPDMYFLNFPIFKTNATEPVKNSPILGCSYFNWDYSTNNDFNCTGSVQEIWDQGHYKCYTLKFNNTLRKNTRAFSAIVYVENVIDNVLKEYDLDITNTRAAGMIVLIHEPGSLPDMKFGTVLETGKSTTMALEQTKVTRLPDPYSNCTAQLTLESADESLLYTRDLCIDVCLQEQYLQACGCIVNMYQFTQSQLLRANNSMCGYLGITNYDSLLNWKGVEQMLCRFNCTEERSACYNECHLPCEEYQYSSRVSASSWPHVTSQLSFYWTFIKGNPRFGDMFDEYMSDYEYNFSNKTAALRILQQLDKEGLIRDNFLQLNVQFKSNAYNQEVEAVAFPVDAFGAQLGGVLSLWLGVTMFVIFEVCEFVINLLTAGWFIKRNRQELAKETVDSRF